jgi:hypothetical protein
MRALHSTAPWEQAQVLAEPLRRAKAAESSFRNPQPQSKRQKQRGAKESDALDSMNYSFRKLIVINTMIVQWPGKIHGPALPGLLYAESGTYFQLQLGMKFSPVWVN